MGSGTSLFEHSYYIGSYMGSILYGFEVTVYIMIIQALFRRGNKNSSNSRRFCAIYSTIMIMLSTIDAACNAVWGQGMWITYRGRPGGVSEYIATEVSVWYESLGSVSVVCSVFMGDALLLYRTFQVYGRRLALIAVPAAAYLIGLGLAIAQLVVAGVPHGNFFGTESVKLAVSYYAITISLNIVLTVFICARLGRVSKQISRTLGEVNARVYTGAAAILVESAAPYSILGIMYLIPYSLHNATGILFGQLWSKMSGLAPLLIILRVVNGRAWREEMMTQTNAPLPFLTSSVDIHPPPIALSPRHSQAPHTPLDDIASIQ